MNNGTKSLLSLLGLGQYCPPVSTMLRYHTHGNEIALEGVQFLPTGVRG